MLTRAQVARRLGRSIATVRRIEGTHLFPRLDRSGVHRFDAADVDALASQIRFGLRLPSGLTTITETGKRREISTRRPTAEVRRSGETLAEQVRSLRERVVLLERVIAELLEGLA